MSVGAVNKQTGDRIPTAGMPAIDSVLSGSSTNPVQNRVVKAALDEKADTDIVASDFSTSASYTAGDYCIYEGKFYKFKATHSGAWAAADVDEIKIAGELSALKSGLTNLHYHKIAESADSGTRASKLESLYATYTALSLDKRKSAILVKNNNDIFQPVNGTGAFSTTYVADQTILLITYLLNPGTYIYALNGTITDASSEENSEVFSLWVCE